MLRRLLPILMLFALVMPVLAPLLALGQDLVQGSDRAAEMRLPACCRRDGKHHCMMSLAAKLSVTGRGTAPGWTAATERCPYCPGSMLTSHVRETMAAPTAMAIYAEVVRHSAVAAQTESKRRVARDRSRQKRGPPLTIRL